MFMFMSATYTHEPQLKQLQEAWAELALKDAAIEDMCKEMGVTTLNQSVIKYRTLEKLLKVEILEKWASF